MGSEEVLTETSIGNIRREEKNLFGPSWQAFLCYSPVSCALLETLETARGHQDKLPAAHVIMPHDAILQHCA